MSHDSFQAQSQVVQAGSHLLTPAGTKKRLQSPCVFTKDRRTGNQSVEGLGLNIGAAVTEACDADPARLLESVCGATI